MNACCLCGKPVYLSAVDSPHYGFAVGDRLLHFVCPPDPPASDVAPPPPDPLPAVFCPICGGKMPFHQEWCSSWTP